MVSLIIAWLTFWERRKAVFLLFFGTVVLLCGLFSFLLTTREDIQALIPEGNASLHDQFAAMRDAPFLHTLTIAAGGADVDPKTLADILAASLTSSGIPQVFTGPGALFPASGIAGLVPRLPVLLPPDQINGLSASFDEESIRAALQKDKRLLLGLAGPALRDLIATDPLRLHERYFQTLAAMQHTGDVLSPDGYFIDSTGRYCLVIAKLPTSMTDASASTAVMDGVRAALALLPPGTQSFVTGSYRHSEANAAIIKSDLNRILPVSLLALGLLFIVFIRGREALAILAVPLSALCMATVATALFYGSISGVVLGFGSVILGITADYAVHSYYAVTRAGSITQSMAALCPPLLAGACTTAFAFAALAFSDIPAIRQMALLGLTGIGAALVLALFGLPLFLRPAAVREVSRPPEPVTFRPLATTGIVVLFGLVAGVAALHLRFDGDIRGLSYTAPEIAEDEAWFRATWKMPQGGSFIVSAGDGTDEGRDRALHRNDQVWDVLRDRAITATSLAPFLPSRDRQIRSKAAWRQLWHEHGQKTLARLKALSPEFGFAPTAFAPFTAWANAEPKLITPEDARAMGLDFLQSMLTSNTSDHSRVYALLPQTFKPDADMRREIQKIGAHYVSGETFRETLAQITSNDIFRFCSLTIAAVTFAVFFVFRSAPRSCMVLLPMLGGLMFNLSLFAFTKTSVNMFHAVALPLVIALSVDYGIFMQAVIEGRMDKNGKKGVVLSALTTLAGFGSLLLARHPALFSLGMAVSGGIAAALATALWIQPLLANRGATPTPGHEES